jgi:outer membrane protein OmpA-like peptidoglycan-associated protein
MENKPVFESFDQFVQFVYEEALNEGLQIKDLTELKTALAAQGLDANGRKALGAIEEVITQGQQPNLKPSFVQISYCLNLMTRTDETEITGIDFESQQLEYSNVLGGAVLDGAGKRVPFAQYLATLNIRNLNAFKKPYYDLKRKLFTNGDDKAETGWLTGSGPVNQFIIVDNKAKLDAKVWRYDNPVKNPVLASGTGFISEPQPMKGKGQDNISIQYYFYYPVKIVPQGGVEYTSREVTQFIREKTTTAETLKPIVIQDDNTLFDVNKSVLKEEGKAAILAALGNVASANSITVTGGASQEGDKARNEALCKERAQAVADYIKSTTSFKSADVKVSDKLDIQPKASTEDRKTWRRVTLNVEGEYLAPVDKTTPELVYMASEDSNKADKIIIAQAIIQLNSSVIA